MTHTPPTLPPHTTFLERGWLSANSVVFTGPEGAAVVDTGYCSHAEQTVALVQAALGGRALERILNTHLHSDHCGGNAALQATWPQVQTWVPPGQAHAVRNWDPVALSYQPTGQECPRFRLEGTLQPGTSVQLGGRAWQVHAAPGHDPHAVLLFEPQDALLISGDALWENGFGVVFPELEGEDAFAAVGATLDLIAQLAPRLVLPGHGSLFGDVPRALATARKRLAGFQSDPHKHALYAAKVLLKYKLLEWQRAPWPQVQTWAQATPLFHAMHQRHFAAQPFSTWVQGLAQQLEQSGAAQREGEWLVNR